MKYLILILLLATLPACRKKVYSGLMYEEGSVSYMDFRPEDTEFVVGLDSDGNATVYTETIPEKYTMKFTCEHGEFTISSDHAKELFYQFRQGDEVIITYRQVDVIKEDDNGKEIDRSFHDWDFVTARKFDRHGPTEGWKDQKAP